MKKVFLVAIVLTAITTSCGILGIHFKVHNPKKEGKVPNFSKEQILLGALTEMRDCFDVTYYDFSLKVNADKKHLDGVVQIHATAIRDFEKLQIDLHSNFEITSLIDYTTKEALEYNREKRAVFVSTTRKKGDEFILEVSYNGKPPEAKKAPWKGGFVWEKDKEKNPWLGVACESDGASLWWALKDHTSDEADSVRMHYTVPTGLTAVGNGKLEGEEEHEGWTTFNWFVSSPINSYNVTIYVGNFRLLKDTYIGVTGKELQMNHYVLRKNYLLASRHFEQLHPILKAFEELFGEYPWYEDGYKLVESPYAGMEHQSGIAYGNGYVNDADNETDYIILHETAHEWWGNSVTARDLADVWLQEGFATYAEALYFEKKDGSDAYRSQLSWNRVMIKNKYPLIGEKDTRWFHFRRHSDVYVKGAWVLHTLRSQIENDSVFFDVIKTFATENRHQLVESKDFIDVVNKKTGADYSWFFDQYLGTNVVPELDYRLDEQSGKVFYRWNNVKPEFDQLHIDIKIGNKTTRITPSKKVQHFEYGRDAKYVAYIFLENALYALNKVKKFK